MRRRASSPGKLILSGEHAVVQGCPALAMAISLKVEVEVESQPPPFLSIELPQQAPHIFEVDELPKILTQTQQRHQAFLEGTLPFDQISQSPAHLLAACAAMEQPSTGLKLRFSSTLPQGAGLGSSAALMLALLKGLNPSRSTSELYSKAVQAENLQHGVSSGLDVAVSLQGGLNVFEQGSLHPLPLPAALPDFQVYHSGRPQSATGECVTRSREVFANTPALKQAFTQVTTQTIQQLEQADATGWANAIRENHRLLCQLGIVPKSVQNVISQIEAAGGSAKVCGAGSIRGDAAGMILITGLNASHDLPDHWQALPLQLSPTGTQLLS
ncbi:hypothetical protein P3T73_06525 [Kiritimatiellota bacterium B12222]|nr:hypothetical protein P3T73_06525 [Kiritimatiellota bacterium B12222]